MKGRKLLYAIIGASILLLASINSVAVFNVPSQKLKEKLDEEKPYIVAVGPPGARSIDQCTVVCRLSEEELNDLKEKIFKSNYPKNMAFDEIIDAKLAAFRKYNILPAQFTIENIKSCINLKSEYNTMGQLNIFPHLKPTFIGKTYFNIGPHLYFMVSVFSRNTFLNFPLYLMLENPYILDKKTVKFLDVFNLTQFKTFLNDTYILQYVGEYIPAQIMLASPIAWYGSLGVLTLTPSTFSILGSFFGAYFIKLVLLGIYIYSAGSIDGHRPPEVPLFDIEMGLNLISIQILLRGEELWSPS